MPVNKLINNITIPSLHFRQTKSSSISSTCGESSTTIPLQSEVVVRPQHLSLTNPTKSNIKNNKTHKYTTTPSSSSHVVINDNENNHHNHNTQQITKDDIPLTYYRITYPGIITLLSSPNGPPTTTHISYGEIISYRTSLLGDNTTQPPSTTLPIHSLLTGGYSPHPHPSPTPLYLPPSPTPLVSSHPAPLPPLTTPTTYKVISSTPLPILTGPSLDAPPSRVLAPPGSLHDISLRIRIDNVVFLKLERRPRGGVGCWIPDRKIIGGNKVQLVMREWSLPPVASHATSPSDDPAMDEIMAYIQPSSLSQGGHYHRRRKRPLKRRVMLRGAVGSDVTTVAPSFYEGTTTATTTTTTMGIHSSPNVSLMTDDGTDVSFQGDNVRDITTSLSTNPSTSSSSLPSPSFYLFRVRSSSGLKILDAPQFQVDRLIHGSSSRSTSTTNNNSNTTSNNTSANPSLFPFTNDTKTPSRILPRGSFFESSSHMEPSGPYTPGKHLIKLSDGSGWVILKEESDVEEMGDAIPSVEMWMRILPRSGVIVSLFQQQAPERWRGRRREDEDDDEESHANTVSPTSSTSEGGGSNVSVGSALSNLVFKTPSKRKSQVVTNPNNVNHPIVLPCGMCIAVDGYDSPRRTNPSPHHFCRLQHGQGWIPRIVKSDLQSYRIAPPGITRGSLWYRVQYRRGIKVRQGPSRRAPGFTGAKGEVFRFECGEFLRVSDVFTIKGSDGTTSTRGPETASEDGEGTESFAKLYRHSHIPSPTAIPSLTTPGEWVQIRSSGRVYLIETPHPPRFERHPLGWRYNAVAPLGAIVRIGPSFRAESTGKILRAGESVLVNERVTAEGDNVTWLRLKDGRGWVGDEQEIEGGGMEVAMIAHVRRERKVREDGSLVSASNVSGGSGYNSLIARLFHERENGSGGVGGGRKGGGKRSDDEEEEDETSVED